MAAAMKKVNMITQNLRLKQVIRSWKTKSLRCGNSSDPDSNQRTPSGSLAVYIGPDRNRFVIPTRFLNLPVFIALLKQAEEEFGYQTTGGLVLPCEPGFFRMVLRFLEEDEEKFRGFELNDFAKLVSESFDRSSSCKDSSASASDHTVTQLLQKTRVRHCKIFL